MLALPAALLVVGSLVATACGGVSASDRGEDAAAVRSEKTSSAPDRTTRASSDPESYVVERKSVRGEEVFFIKQRPGDLPASAAGGGELAVDKKGCLRMHNPGEGLGFLLVWPADFEMSTEGGEIRILNGKGLVMARVGDVIRIGGGGISAPEAGFENAEQLGRHFNVPKPCRRGAYWVIGEWGSTRRSA